MKAVKQLVRTISANPSPMTGADSVQDVDAELQTWFDKGYELFDTHLIGTSSGNVTVMYILVLDGEKRGRKAKEEVA